MNINIRKSDLVVKKYDENATIKSYRKKFKDKRSEDPIINKLKDWLFDNLKTTIKGDTVVDLLGGSEYDKIADFLNEETVLDTDSTASITELSDCIDIEEFMVLSATIQQTWTMIRGKSGLTGNASTINGLKLMFGEESRTFKKIKKLLSRKKTLFESLLSAGETFTGDVTPEMIKLSTK